MFYRNVIHSLNYRLCHSKTCTLVSTSLIQFASHPNSNGEPAAQHLYVGKLDLLDLYDGNVGWYCRLRLNIDKGFNQE